MKILHKFIVCGRSSFKLLYPATFNGNWQEAVPFFSTNRCKAVHDNIVKCNSCGLSNFDLFNRSKSCRYQSQPDKIAEQFISWENH
jgi:hypothetical protein